MDRNVFTKSPESQCSKSMDEHGSVCFSTFCSKPCKSHARRRSDKRSGSLGDVQSPLDEIPPPSAHGNELPSFGIGERRGSDDSASSHVLISLLCVTKCEDDLAICCAMRGG